MTEEEAKQKWCPQVRTLMWVGEKAEHPLISNRAVDEADGYDERHCCIGSDCMMWRWIYLQNGEKTPRGFCGLGGKP
jgi:hypothetical protein